MSDGGLDPRSAPLWWLGTWVTGSMASGLLAAALFLPTSDDEGLGAHLATPIGLLGISLLAMWAIFLGGTWLASRRIGTGDPIADVGLAFRPLDVIGIPIGIAAQLLLLPVVYLPLQAIWPDTFTRERLEDTASDLVERADGPAIVLLVALVVVGAPIVEEIFYRGLLQRPLQRAFPPVAAVAGVAALFGVVHFRPVEFPGLFAAGLVFGVCAWRADRLGLAIAAHVAFNATGVVAVM